jgi:hypothetical protein
VTLCCSRHDKGRQLSNFPQDCNVSDVPAFANDLSHACFGLKALGSCAYDPAKPFSVYFSVGNAVGALAFTLAVQQLLKPIYRFRLAAAVYH